MPDDRDATLLRAYLSERDAPCPRCGYNLRNQGPGACPECGGRVALGLRAEGGRAAWGLQVASVLIPLVVQIASLGMWLWAMMRAMPGTMPRQLVVYASTEGVAIAGFIGVLVFVLRCRPEGRRGRAWTAIGWLYVGTSLLSAVNWVAWWI